MSSTPDGTLSESALFGGLDLRGLAERWVGLDLAAGAELWRQGQTADALHVIETGRVEITVRLPGERQTVLAKLGPGDVIGELALLDDGGRTAAVRALEPTRLRGISHRDFHSVLLSRDAGARELRRRLIELACRRLANRQRALAGTLDGSPNPPRVSRAEAAGAPADAYLLQLPFFRGFRRDQIQELLTRASIIQVAPGALLVAEDEPSPAMYVTLNGAVEEVIRRAGSAIRLALLGPGRGFGYAGLIGGQVATATAAARERSVVLVLAADELMRQLGDDPFASAIERDAVAALRQAERPQARLAARIDARAHP